MPHFFSGYRGMEQALIFKNGMQGAPGAVAQFAHNEAKSLDFFLNPPYHINFICSGIMLTTQSTTAIR